MPERVSGNYKNKSPPVFNRTGTVVSQFANSMVQSLKLQMLKLTPGRDRDNPDPCLAAVRKKITLPFNRYYKTGLPICPQEILIFLLKFYNRLAELSVSLQHNLHNSTAVPSVQVREPKNSFWRPS